MSSASTVHKLELAAQRQWRRVRRLAKDPRGHGESIRHPSAWAASGPTIRRPRRRDESACDNEGE